MRDTIEDLLNQWEEGFERGRPPSAEMLCVDHPELLEELKSQIEALKAIDSDFGRILGHSPQSSEQAARTSRLNQRLVVNSEFQIDRLHASGGLGDVYLASEPNLKRQVAIKFPRQDRLNAQQMARFEREAQITGRLNHPGVVPVFSLKQDDLHQPCYVMRFIDGVTLKHRIEQLHQQPSSKGDFFTNLEFRQLLQSFVALCNIVAYSHDQGIIHRDIKPENVILGPFGETMLMDWGLAKILNEPGAIPPAVPAASDADTISDKSLETRDGQVMGTPAYASPEQLQGRVDQTDSRSDIYSLGTTLHFLLTGANDCLSRSGASHRNGTTVPKRLVAICGKAMAELREDRYQAVAELRDDVERFLAGEAVSVVTETIWSRFVRSVRRRPGVSAAFLVGITMAILAGIAGSWLLNEKNRELSTTNEQLELAVEESQVAKKRATSTSDILKRAMLAATPEEAQGTEPTVRQLLDELAEQLRDDESIDLLVAADSHYTLAEAYDKLGLYDTAQKHADVCNSIYERELGPESSETLFSQGLQAKILSARDRDVEAQELAGDALARARKIESLDPNCLITLLDHYATAKGFGPDPDHDEVLSVNREAYDLSLKEFGPDHATTISMASNVAATMLDCGDLDGAEVLLDEIHRRHESLFGKSHPETLTDMFNIIALKVNKGEIQAAHDLCQEQLKNFEEVFGPNHLTSIRIHLTQCQIFASLGHLDAAYKEAEIAWQRAKDHLGPVHQQTFEARGMLATVLLFQNRLDEAEKLCVEHFEIAKENFGPTHSYTVQAVTLLFDLAEKRNDPETMAKWAEHLRGSQWEAAAEEQVKAAREKKRNEEEAGSNVAQ